MKKKIKIVVAVVIALALVFIGICTYMGYLVFKGSMQMVTNETTSLDKGIEYLNEVGFDLDEFKNSYQIDKIQIDSTLDGHIIPADRITVNGNTNKNTVVLVHGMGGNRLTMYPYAEMFLKNGYNVIAYDQRSSGENTAKYTTYGYFESSDLMDYVAYAYEMIGEDKKLGVFGVSFGGATVGISLGSEEVNDMVDFAILDSPISNMKDMLSMSMGKDEDMPVDFLLSVGNIFTRLKLGFSYEDTNVSRYICNTQVPVMVVSSKADEVTPIYMSEQIIDAIYHSGKSWLTVEDSKHAEAFFDYPKQYEQNVMEFIDKY